MNANLAMTSVLDGRRWKVSIVLLDDNGRDILATVSGRCFTRKRAQAKINEVWKNLEGRLEGIR